jgi:hypothetical protein
LKTEVEFLPVTKDRLFEFEQALRPEDQREIDALMEGKSAIVALSEVVNKSEWAAIAYTNGEPAAIVGIVPVKNTFLFEGVFRIYFFTTHAVDRYPKTFLQHTRSAADRLRRTYGHLETWVDLRYDRAVRWLHWLGAEFVGDVQKGYLQKVRL